jgi:hypothetical protein
MATLVNKKILGTNLVKHSNLTAPLTQQRTAKNSIQK